MKLLRILIIISSFIGISNCLNAQKNIVDEVVWMVGDEPILKSDIEYQKLRLISENGHIDGNLDCVIPENIAIQKLFLNQAKIDSISPDEAQVTRYVEMWIQNAISQVGSKEKLEEYFGKKISQIREDERKEARNQEIVRSMQQKIVQGIQVSPSDIRSFYSSMNRDSIPYVPETVEIQVINIQPKEEVSQVDSIKRILREFADDIKAGKKDFSTIARIYSQDSRTALQGGEYGYVSKGNLDEDFARTVFNLSPNTPVSSVIKTESGYHLVQIIDKKGDMVNFRHILIKPKISDDAIKKATNLLDSITGDIRKGNISFEDAAQLYSFDKKTRNNGGLMVNDKQDSQFEGTPNFQIQDLPQEIAKQAYEMKEGDISSPFTMHNKNGIEEVVVIKMKRINKGHIANTNDDYTLIKQLALQNKRSKKLDEWIRDKQKTTFIEINEQYRNCNFKYPNWLHK